MVIIGVINNQGQDKKKLNALLVQNKLDSLNFRAKCHARNS